MNVWIVNHYSTPPTMAGGSRHVSLASELIRRGHGVTLIAASFDHDSRREAHLLPHEDAKLEVINSVPFVWLRTPSYGGNARRFWNMAAFGWRVMHSRFLDRLPKPDLIVGCSLTLFAAYGAMRVARRLRIPFVLEIRDLWPQTLIDFGMSRLHPAVLVFGALERRLYQGADGIMTVLPGSIDYMRQHGAGADTPIFYVPNGVDFSVVPQPRPLLQNHVFTVMYAGSYGTSYGLDSILRAAAIVQDHQLPVRFSFVGEGLRGALEPAVARMRLRNVDFPPSVPKSRIYDTLSRADALLATLRDVPLYRYGMSLNKLYDYMASARPVIFAVKSFNDPVAESRCGLTIAPEDPQALADAIQQLAAMPIAERWAMALRGRAYVEQQHSFTLLAQRLEQLLIAATQRHRRAGAAEQHAAAVQANN